MDNIEKNNFKITQEITVLSQMTADVLASLRHYLRKTGDVDGFIAHIYKNIVMLQNSIYGIKTHEEAMVTMGKLQIISESLEELRE